MTAYSFNVVSSSRTERHSIDHFSRSPGNFEFRRRISGRIFIKPLLLVAGGISFMLFAANTPYAVTTLSSLDLRTVSVPGPSQDVLNEFIADKAAAIQLGKALFWDPRVGSDNKTACASCHFSAGADARTKNQLDPGLLRLPKADTMFQLGDPPNYYPNYQLKESDFPFTRFMTQNPETNEPSLRSSDINDVASSQGVFSGEFKSNNVTNKDALPDVCDYSGGDPDGFHMGALNTRRVEPRNTPTVINAVFNFRNFWDGRANNVFNGGDPFGLRNDAPLVWKKEAGILRKVKVAIESSSVASQGSGPPSSKTEMSCSGRTFVDLGKKILRQKILKGQVISPDDSVLGQFANDRPPYMALVKQAFNPNYWQSPDILRFSKADARERKSMDLHGPDASFDQLLATDTSQLEYNFGLFFSLSMQMYQSTLVADNSRFDQYARESATGTSNKLDDDERAGLAIFQGKGHCINCHGGAELTNASFRSVIDKRLEVMLINGKLKTYDNGFYNIGVRRTMDDIGIGGTDKFGLPLSESLIFLEKKRPDLLGNGFDASKYATVPNEVNVNGAFKTPGLRNVELTGPYFHNGGKATLMQVVDHYNRGGDFGKENEENLDVDIQPLGLDKTEKINLVKFLLTLTDDRVKMEKAPFDHPSLCIPNGHTSKGLPSTAYGVDAADSEPLCINAVGSQGSAYGISRFMNLSPFSP